jgi:ubiquinone/menaquinone biosynthesis C-methylase UbiE
MVTVDLKRLNIRAGDKIFDIGCGSGRHTCEVYRYKEIIVIGSDLNIKDLNEADSRLRYHDQLGEHGGGIWGLNAADIRNLPFKDNSFDHVICSEVMEHIPDEKSALLELARVLKPGKFLALSVPRYLPERICWLLSDDYHQANQGHLRIYKKRNLVELIERTGFTIRGSHYAHSLHAPYWCLKCLLGPTREDVGLVNLYDRFLTWNIMQKPRLTHFLDHLLNPIMGKSLVLYFQKSRPICS